ncbi:FAD-dependent thymidylate synthase [Brevibacillus laterosporus]|uniref:Flavin-dependent thymidylate synthase n=1 Tax=Brevibacillus laterosporus TaxID=1465 RepID=A0AAP3GA53_BRELA|nr:FAD-dependent thymidylate synthase [Brevibacillus laterosporus]MCR8983087.1 FAD-dependent thymidylate synthase [Brevibacillus laterosporus]MCZ0810243.1 FAD-dependent thymidylate synthase [Brevibacillus laterosporus]MCZ0828902.1 FAD-dependent thymidylate synthase [Brevibacillus laterosporus]MCZ0852957.1 FAD-dependent thymidylate synthase [Brevibacillus laterosporus]
MSVKLISHTQLSEEFYDSFDIFNEFIEYDGNQLDRWGATDGQAVALTAIRTCYSANKPSEIVALEGDKYFGQTASDGEGGTEADRLFRHITRSGHTSTTEHLTFTFAIEGVSRALLAQLTRHRVGFSFSVQSQRYVRMGSSDKTGGFDYVVPRSINEKGEGALAVFRASMRALQADYDALREAGVPPEDARMVLPNAAATNLVMTVNLRALLDFYGKRREGRGSQWEIAELAEQLRREVTKAEPWTAPYFDVA